MSANENDLIISPIVNLVLTYLPEINRLHVPANEIIDTLKDQFELRYCQHAFQKVIERASSLKWTSDPFDRIITAQAGLENCRLLTKDQTILKNYPQAVWD